MNCSEPQPQSPPNDPLYPGDTGELTLETRQVLVQLLSGPSVDGQRHGNLWPVLRRDEAVIRKRLAELFLELVVDHDQQVGFVRQADTAELDTPRLLRRAALTYLESVLLLHLRQALIQAETRDERAVVSVQDLIEALAVYERVTDADRTRHPNKTQHAIEKMKKLSILQKVRASEDRYEISPTLRLLFSTEEIQQLILQYQAMARGEETAVMPEPCDEGEDE